MSADREDKTLLGEGNQQTLSAVPSGSDDHSIGYNIQYYSESDQNHRKKRYLAHLGSNNNDISAPAENSELQMLYFEIKFVAPHLQELLLSVPRNSSIR